VTRDRMYLETMQQIYQNVSKVMVDTKSNSNLLYLPLDRLIQQGGSGVSSIVPPIAPAPATPSNNEPSAAADVRSREGQRSRDRDAR